MYSYNKNILEYARIVVTHANSTILDVEGRSNKSRQYEEYEMYSAVI